MQFAPSLRVSRSLTGVPGRDRGWAESTDSIHTTTSHTACRSTESRTHHRTLLRRSPSSRRPTGPAEAVHRRPEDSHVMKMPRHPRRKREALSQPSVPHAACMCAGAGALAITASGEERICARPPHLGIDRAGRTEQHALGLEVGALCVAAGVGRQAALAGGSENAPPRHAAGAQPLL